MSEHTPRPWTIDRDLDLSHGGSVAIRSGGILIAEVFKTDDQIHHVSQDPVAEANACLITAAPALLEALEKLADETTPHLSWAVQAHHEGIEGWMAAMEAANAAIAQAKP